MTKVMSSRFQHLVTGTSPSTANSEPVFPGNQSELHIDCSNEALRGSMDDARIVRAALVESIRRCGKSREQIAEEMSFLTGSQVTVRRLNAFTAESREDFRWPAELDRAFCLVTGSDELLRCRAELAGLKVIGPEEAELLEIGREFLRQKRASDRLRALEQKMQGVNL